jgi:hypothetical protein
MCITRQRRYAIGSRTPAAARDFGHAAVVSALNPRGWVYADDASLVISELVTEAVVSGAQWLLLTVELHFDHLVITGRDDRPRGWRGRAEPSETRRRLLDELTSRWSADDDADGTVWVARIRCDPATTDGLPCDLRPARV